MIEIAQEQGRDVTTLEQIDPRRTVEGHLKVGIGLELAAAVDDECEAGAADAEVFNQRVERLEIDGCLDHEVLTAFGLLGRDNEVWGTAQTGGGRVVGQLEVERSGICDLDAVGIDQPEIDECTVVLLPHEVEGTAHELGVPEPIDGVLAGDHADVAQPIVELCRG